MKKDNTNENKVLSVREGRAVMKVLAINVQITFKKMFCNLSCVHYSRKQSRTILFNFFLNIKHLDSRGLEL